MPSLWYTPDAVFTHTWPLPAGGAFCAEGEEPPLDAADFDEVDFAAGAEFDAELLFEAGAAAGAADFDEEAGALELAGAADESDDAAVDFFERDFLVVEAEPSEPLDADAASDFEAVLEADDASVDESAAFFEWDFLVVPVAESEFEADFESASVDESVAFFEWDFLVVPVEASDFEALASSDEALVFLDFDEPDVDAELSSDDEAVDFFLVDFDAEPVEEALLLESSVELPSDEAAFFFFLLFEVVLSELLSLDEPLADELDWALADFAAIDADPKTRAAHASAVKTFCHSVFMIVPPVRGDANYAFCLLARPAAYALAFSNRPCAAGDSRAATQLSKWPLNAVGKFDLKWFTTVSTISCALSCGRPVFCIITWTSSFMLSSPLSTEQFEVIPGPDRKNAAKTFSRPPISYWPHTLGQGWHSAKQRSEAGNRADCTAARRGNTTWKFPNWNCGNGRWYCYFAPRFCRVPGVLRVGKN